MTALINPTKMLTRLKPVTWLSLHHEMAPLYLFTRHLAIIGWVYEVAKDTKLQIPPPPPIYLARVFVSIPEKETDIIEC